MMEIKTRYLPPGTILEERYVVGRVIGQGSFGITYIGRDTLFDDVVAVKEYFPAHHVFRNVTGDEGIKVCLYEDEDQTEYEQMMGKFLDEAKRLSQFREVRGIVSVRDFFFANNTAYMVMEYVEGVSLKEYVEKNGPMKGEWVLLHMDPLMDALERIHETGLIHRDISPDNIIVKPDSSLELIDFGSARQTNTEEEKSLTVVFKRGFSPAEQYRSRGEQGIFTDVYAVCATMYFCLTGKVPDEALERIFVDETPSLLSMPEIELSRSQKKAVMKGISVRAQERYSSIRELRMALNGETGRHNRGKVLCAMGVTVCLIAGIIYHYVSGDEGMQDERMSVVSGSIYAGRDVPQISSGAASSAVQYIAESDNKPVLSPAVEKTYRVPSVVGLDQGKAKKKLKQKKMKVTLQWIDSQKEKNMVISQSVKKGKKVRAGTKIRLKVSRGKAEPEPTPVPTARPTPLPKPAATKKPSQEKLDGMID